MSQTFEGKVAVLTGGASGIGFETARLLVERGAEAVVLADFDEARGRAAEQALKEEGREALFIPTDVTLEDRVIAMVARIVEAYGHVDILVNAAGGPVRRNTFTDCTLETWNACFAQNVTGTFLCSREVLKHMATQGSGAIVNISSAAAYLGNPGGSVHYAAAKGAILSMTVGMGREFAARGIRINAISPGPFETPFQDKFATPQSRDKVLAKVPAGRIGHPREAAELIAFLLSDASPYVTGTTIRIDGGLTGG